MSWSSWSYCVEVLHPRLEEGLCYLSGGDHARHGVAVADGLSHGNNVGHKVLALQLESPEVGANTPETHLDLIGNENAARLVDMSTGMGT